MSSRSQEVVSVASGLAQHSDGDLHPGPGDELALHRSFRSKVCARRVAYGRDAASEGLLHPCDRLVVEEAGWGPEKALDVDV